jgi:hypothetical protein
MYGPVQQKAESGIIENSTSFIGHQTLSSMTKAAGCNTWGTYKESTVMKYPVQSWIPKFKEARQWGNLNFGGGSQGIDGHERRFYWKPRLIVCHRAPADRVEMQPYE